MKFRRIPHFFNQITFFTKRIYYFFVEISNKLKIDIIDVKFSDYLRRHILNIYEFISTIIKSIAWPIVILIIAIMLRRPLTKILSNLNRLTYNNLEMEFSEKLEEIQTTLETKNGIASNNQTNSKELEIKAVAEVSPAASITMAWSMIEQEIQNTVKRLAISPDYPLHNSALKNIQLLQNQELIDLDTVNTLSELRNLRNKAVHGNIANENISYLEAIKYYELSRKVTRLLRNIRN